jgi:hypothetical protein
MPLIKSASNAARERNIQTEIASGRDPRQAVAIGYSEQRRARGKKRSPSLADVKAHRRAKEAE